MKIIIIILLSFIVSESSAQKKEKELPNAVSVSDYVRTEYKRLVSGKHYDTTSLLKIKGSYSPAMTIMNPDSSGTIKVYINRKKIKWTSDSTFVIERK